MGITQIYTETSPLTWLTPWFTVWGYDYFGDVRTVDVTVRRLREKVENDSSQPEYIMTRRGVGYFIGEE